MINPEVVSFAQHGEDIVLETILSGITEGFYVDVGANHPTRHSVTKKFYDKGWRGINIEPNPRLYKLLAEARPKDTNLNLGVSDKKGTLELRLYHSRDGLEGLSTFSAQVKTDNEKSLTADNSKYSDIRVPVKTLASILSENKVKQIDFMKVDVEGLEYEVLISNDWARFRPTIICVEANHIIHDWHGILKKEKYTLLYSDGLNEYFVVNEQKDHLAGQDLVGRIVVAGTDVISPELYELWQGDRNDSKNLRALAKRQQIILDKMSGDIAILERKNTLSLRDRTYFDRLKRAVYGLTVDWFRYKVGNHKKSK